MSNNLDLSKLSQTELLHMLPLYGHMHPTYKTILSELAKREKADKISTTTQFRKSIFWSRIAAGAAIVGVLLTLLQLLFSIFPFHF